MESAYLVVVSDLEGMLLDQGNYAVGAAAEGLDLLAAQQVPLVICSGKTRAEIEVVQREFGIRHPVISENGGALFVPDRYFPFDVQDARALPGWRAIEFGRPYRDLVYGLRAAAFETGIAVRGFHDMSVEEVAWACQLPLRQAHLAKQREYDEPFRLCRHLPAERARLQQALRRHGLFCTPGGGFEHVTGATDKGLGILRLRVLYERAMQEPVVIVGLGSSLDDLSLLREVDIPIIVRGDSASGAPNLRARVPFAHLTAAEGPAGWTEGIRTAFQVAFGSWPQTLH